MSVEGGKRVQVNQVMGEDIGWVRGVEKEWRREGGGEDISKRRNWRINWWESMVVIDLKYGKDRVEVHMRDGMD